MLITPDMVDIWNEFRYWSGFMYDVALIVFRRFTLRDRMAVKKLLYINPIPR